jgi:tetrahydromethanopterin S-methyltransferase subunit G
MASDEPGAVHSVSESAMTSADSLSLILRRLDEIERKLDRIMEELRTPTAIGYSIRRGNLPKKD